MCWSFWISMGFSSCHLLTSLLVQKRPYRLFLYFYAFMEFFQALQWVWGDLMPGSNFGHLGCSTRNQIFTVVAYALIWIQPYLYFRIGNLYNRYLHNLTRWIFFWAMLSLFIGSFKIPTYRIPNSNYGLSTCSEIGPHGHLGWRFAPLTAKYSPNEFVYVTSIALIFMEFPRSLSRTLGLGWFLTMLVSIYYVGTGPDLPAFWCFLSVFVDLPIIIGYISKNRIPSRNNL